MKQDLRGLDLAELTRSLLALGEKPFRARQIFGWVQGKGAGSFEQMANLPAGLRRVLAGHFCFTALSPVKKTGDDSTRKYLWRLKDGLSVESVLLDDDGRRTICLSTQVGCRMGCRFCATGRVRFRRNLSAGEIISQVLEIEREAGPASNLVYMGMGEPLDNYDETLKSIRILNDPAGRNFGLRRITISTAGLVPAIYRLADEELPLKLAVSLNAAADPERSRLMPINQKHPLKLLRPALETYARKSGRRVTAEYVLIDRLNSSRQDALALVRFLEGLKANVNLIAFNPYPGCRYQAPPADIISRFRQVLDKAGLEVSQRFIRGQSFGAACGQLTGGYP